MAVNERRVAVLGAGTLGEALIAGLISGGWRKPDEIVATGRREERVNELREKLGVEATLSNADAVADAALIVIAVKPQDFDVLLEEIAPVVSPDQTVLSVAAAIPTTAIEERLPKGVPVVRAMPNAPAIVHEGIAGMCAGANADEPHLALAEEALLHLGAVVRVPEPYMDAVTPRTGHLARRHDDPGGARAGASRRSRRLPERYSGGNGPLARARGRRAVRARDAELIVTDDEESAAKRVAELLAEAARAGGEIALTGGSTPRRAYELAADLEPDWSGAGVWWGDERCVPPEDERSNFGLARRTLLDRLEAHPGRVHRIRGEDEPAAAAASYDQELRGTTLDLLLLGLGPDGHVASLFPNSPGLTETERLAIPAEAKLDPFVERVTLTPPALRSARRIVFLVTGEQKAEAVAGVLAGPPDPAVPGSLIRAESGETLAILDQKAASRLRD